MQNHVIELFSYTRWANDRIVDACEGIPAEDLARDLGGSFPSILAIFGHLIASDWLWLERCHGRSPPGFPEHIDLGSLPAVQLQWSALQDRRRQWLRTVREAELGEMVHYRDLAGVPQKRRLIRLLLHIVNHSTYHRGQLTVYLRQLGHRPPSTDFIRWKT